MPSKHLSAFASTISPSAKIIPPGNLQGDGVGLNAIDLKTVAITPGNAISLGGGYQFTICLIEVITGTTPGAGSANLEVALFAEDGATQLSEWTILATLGFGDAAGTFRKILGLLGHTGATKSGVNWTLGTPADIDSFRCFANCRFRINVTAGFTLATTATASVYVLANA